MDYIKLWINHSPDQILYLPLIVVQIKILYWLQVFVKIFVLLYSPFFSVNKGLDEYIMNFFISLIIENVFLILYSKVIRDKLSINMKLR